ncbi:hypothetical protein ACO0QE_003655 [Hanseniaspora vineae]
MSLLNANSISSRGTAVVNKPSAPADRQHDTNSAEELNILVAVRCRGRNDREAKSKSPVVVTIPESDESDKKPKEICLNTTGDIGITAQLNAKTYTVDRVFGPNSGQERVFTDIANPLFLDFLKGYNCTVLVYGMTSTGKTYTMTGDEKLQNDQLSPEAGIIPRVLFKLFETLEQEALDYIVKCSFIELYNEELKDLLADGTASDNAHKKLKIFDSSLKKTRSQTPELTHSYSQPRAFRSVSLSQPNLSSRFQSSLKNSRRNVSGSLRRTQSGTYDDLSSTTSLASNTASGNKFDGVNNHSKSDSVGLENSSGIFIQNLQEFEITNAKQGIKLLQRGLKLRQVASTNMNDFSSRSHSIFTITLYKNHNGELFRLSKMNMVDLAGSENVSRSGAINQRAKEAGSVNQSLLTLGRVINSLVDKSVHVPFRESKLTRLLQDSLGGNTKTALIATISPAKINSEETASTLEYATKAKNIKNKPQIGSVLTKDILVKNLALELSKIKTELYNTKSKVGIHLDSEQYDELMRDMENYKTETQENSRCISKLKQQNESLAKEKKNAALIIERQTKEIKQLEGTLSYIYDKMDKQHKNELNLVDHAKQLVKAISLLKDSKRFYNEAKQKSKSSLSDIVRTSLFVLQEQALKEFSSLEKQASSYSTFGEHSFTNIKNGFAEMVSKMSESTNNLCSTVIDKIMGDNSALNESILSSLNSLDASISEHVQHTNQSLSVISDYCNDCNYYINEKLFTSANEKVISSSAEKAYAQLQSNSSQMVENFQKMMEQQLKSSKKIIFGSLNDVTAEVKRIERANFEPNKKKLLEAIENINKCDSSNIKFEETYKKNIKTLSASMDKYSETSSKVEEYMSTELSHLEQYSANLIKDSSVLTELEKLQENHVASVSTVAESLQSAETIKSLATKIEAALVELANEPSDSQQRKNEVLLQDILSDLESKQFKPVESTGKTPSRPQYAQDATEARILLDPIEEKNTSNEGQTASKSDNYSTALAKENGSPVAPAHFKRRSTSSLDTDMPAKKKTSF